MGYFALVSADTEIRLWICERSHRSVCITPQRHVRKIGLVSVWQLSKVPSYFFIVVDGKGFHAGSARSNGSVEGMSAVDTVRYYPTVLVPHSFRDEELQSPERNTLSLFSISFSVFCSGTCLCSYQKGAAVRAG